MGGVPSAEQYSPITNRSLVAPPGDDNGDGDGETLDPVHDAAPASDAEFFAYLERFQRRTAKMAEGLTLM